MLFKSENQNPQKSDIGTCAGYIGLHHVKARVGVIDWVNAFYVNRDAEALHLFPSDTNSNFCVCVSQKKSFFYILPQIIFKKSFVSD